MVARLVGSRGRGGRRGRAVADRQAAKNNHSKAGLHSYLITFLLSLSRTWVRHCSLHQMSMTTTTTTSPSPVNPSAPQHVHMCTPSHSLSCTPTLYPPVSTGSHSTLLPSPPLPSPSLPHSVDDVRHVEVLQSTEELVEEVGDAVVVQFKANHTRQVGVHRLHHNVSVRGGEERGRGEGTRKGECFTALCKTQLGTLTQLEGAV